MDIKDVNALDAIPLPRKRRLLVDALVSAYPRVVSEGALKQWMWEDDGYQVPESPSLFVHISKTRSILEQHGWTIAVRRFQGWRLVKIETQSGRRAA